VCEGRRGKQFLVLSFELEGEEFLVLSWGEKSFYPSIRPRTWFLVFIELCVSKGTRLFRAVIIDIRPIEPVLLEECCHNSGGIICISGDTFM